MKSFTVSLKHDECKAIHEIISSDIEELVLEDNIRTAYDEILCGIEFNSIRNDNYINFVLDDDKTAMEIVQMFLVYAERCASAEGFSTRASALYRFATQMLVTFTNKTEEDF